MEFLGMTVDFEGLVLLRLGGPDGVEAHCIPCKEKGHWPRLVIDDQYVDRIDPGANDAELKKRVTRDPSGRTVVDLTGLYSALGEKGGVRHSRSADLATAAKYGWRDLFWALDLAYLAGRNDWPLQPPTPTALTLFRSGYLDGSRPTSAAMRNAEWELRPQNAGTPRTQWLTDGMLMEVALPPAEDGRAAWAFERLDAPGGGALFRIVLKEGADGSSPRATLSNMCAGGSSGALNMDDVEEYGGYLGEGYVTTPPQLKEKRSGVRSPNATRCPPAYF